MNQELSDFCKKHLIRRSEVFRDFEARDVFHRCFDTKTKMEMVQNSLEDFSVMIRAYSSTIEVGITHKGLWNIFLNNEKYIHACKINKSRNIDNTLDCFPMLCPVVDGSKSQRYMVWSYKLSSEFNKHMKNFLELMRTNKSQNLKTLYRKLIREYPKIFGQITEKIAIESMWSAKELASVFQYDEVQEYYANRKLSKRTTNLLEWVRSELLLEVIAGKQKTSHYVNKNIKILDTYLEGK